MSFAEQVVVLADEFVIVEDVELFTSAELLATNAAGETVEVEYFVTGLSDKVRGSDTLTATAAFCAVASEKEGIF